MKGVIAKPLQVWQLKNGEQKPSFSGSEPVFGVSECSVASSPGQLSKAQQGTVARNSTRIASIKAKFFTGQI